VEAALDLEKILDVMNQYPKMKLDIRSHTDSRGSFKYNESLSDSTINNRMVNRNGVDKTRLTAKDMGNPNL
jgi:peptidoglycan-associated lipoprotein